MSKKKPQILQVHHAFLVHFFAVSARQGHEISYAMLFGGRKHQ